jgi:hypothetical protein
LSDDDGPALGEGVGDLGGAVLVIAGWPVPYAWTLADLRRIRREITFLVGPDRALALDRLDVLIAEHGG